MGDEYGYKAMSRHYQEPGSTAQALFDLIRIKGKVYHADTPWSVNDKNSIRDSEGRVLAITLATKLPDEYKVNAEFIVTACNNHDDLVRMLKRALPYLQNTPFIHAQVEDTLKQVEEDSNG